MDLATTPVFAGFDTFAYPGDAFMDAARATTNLSFVCPYIGGPSNASWRAGLLHLRKTGWGLAPVYVGGQVTGPGSHDISAARGTRDGTDAAGIMAAIGMPTGSCVYLDLENGAPLTPAQRAYVVAWCASVRATGGKPGVYCSYQMGAAVHAAVPDARIWVFHVATTSRHANAAKAFPTGAKSPAASGFPGAVLWQHEQNVTITVGGHALTVDLNASRMSDPSGPDAPTAVQPETALPVVLDPLLCTTCHRRLAA